MNVLNIIRVGEYESRRLRRRNIDGYAGGWWRELISRDTAALEGSHRVAADLVTEPGHQALVGVSALGPVLPVRLFASRTEAPRAQPGLTAAVSAGKVLTGGFLTESSLVRVVRAVLVSVTVLGDHQTGAVTAGLLGWRAGGVELTDAGVFVSIVLHVGQVTVGLPVTQPGLHHTFPGQRTAELSRAAGSLRAGTRLV